MELKQLLDLLEQSPGDVEFNGVIALIDSLYEFTPVAFTNGKQENSAGENSGSCKLFSFARLQGLDEQQTLNCFGQFYQNDVLKNPDGVNHQNIRNFIQTGWDGISFQGDALTQRDV